MLAKVMRLRCAGHGAKVTTGDGLKGAGVILGGTILSVLLAAWMERRSVDPLYAQALMTNGWLVSTVVSLRYTTLKGWPGRTDAGDFHRRAVDAGRVAGVRRRVDERGLTGEPRRPTLTLRFARCAGVTVIAAGPLAPRTRRL